MLKRIMSKFQSLFFQLFLVLIVSTAVVLIVVSTQSKPSLDQVLQGNPAPQANNFSVFLGSLLGVSVAALSAAKGYELVKRHRMMSEVVICQEALTKHQNHNENLSGRLEDLEQQSNFLREQNLEIIEHNDQLKHAIRALSDELSKVKTAEQMLRKSNISLAKECERLKFENETITLKANSMPAKPKRKTSAKVKAKKKRK
ncbi:MAG: hypothetical protein ABIE84_01495 [bacterium]